MSNPVFERERRDSRYGRIDVFVARDLDGTVLREVVPMSCLADILDLPPTTVQGRYVRSGLQRWAVYVRNGAGRPERGFPLVQLDDVIAILSTPGARVRAGAAEDPVPHHLAPVEPDRGFVRPLVVGGQRYYTPQALAEHFGCSLATVRRRIASAGFTRRMVNLPSVTGTGRPRRAFPESALADVTLLLDDGASMRTDRAHPRAVAPQIQPAPASPWTDLEPAPQIQQAAHNAKQNKEIPMSRPLQQAARHDPDPAAQVAAELQAALDALAQVDQPASPRPEPPESPESPRWVPITQAEMQDLLDKELRRALADCDHIPSHRADEIHHNAVCSWRPWAQANGLDLAALHLDDPRRLVDYWDECWTAARRERFPAFTAARRMVMRVMVEELRAGKLTDDAGTPVTDLTAGHVFAVHAFLGRDVGMDFATRQEVASEVSRAHGRARLSKAGRQWEHTPECQAALAWLRKAWETENPTPDYQPVDVETLLTD